jgi:hypothetical protein
LDKKIEKMKEASLDDLLLQLELEEKKKGGSESKVEPARKEIMDKQVFLIATTYVLLTLKCRRLNWRGLKKEEKKWCLLPQSQQHK